MKRLLVFLLLVLISCCLGGVYGILHDQLTYSISNEYYTKFKFLQFGFVDFGNEAILHNPRIYVAIVGFLATWWMGLFIGVVLALLAFIHSDSKLMFIITMKSFIITILIAFLTGLLGLAYGHFILAGRPQKEFYNWYIPGNLIDFKSFITVGSMHNFSYMGGVIGLIAGMIYSITRKPKLASGIFWWAKR